MQILFFFILFSYNESMIKLSAILYSVAFIGATGVISASSISLFNNFYYETIFVSGSSMYPTLEGNWQKGEPGQADYGIVDNSYGAKKSLKRYQIVTTHYFEQDESYKIKRVIFLPGETFKVEDNDLFLYKNDEWYQLPIPYDRNIDSDSTHRNYPVTTLKEDEYFLSGDNYVASYDSFTLGPVSFDLLVGVVVRMEGKCKVQDGKVVEKEEY